MAKIPRNFIAVDAAKSRKFQPLNVMGVVVDALPPRQTGGSSFGVTFTIKDCDFTSDAWWGLKVRFFRDRQADLPSPNLGDVVLLRMIQVRDYQGAPVAFSAQRDALNSSLAWSIFRLNPRVPGDLLITNSKESPSPEEKAYALSLLNRESYSGNVPAPAPALESTPANPVARRSFYKDTATTPGKVKSPASNLRKFSLLQDLECWRFADIVGQVVKTFPASYDRFTLYVTDYTTHKDLFNYSDGNDGEGHDPGDPYGYISRRQREWPGPFGRMTIQVTLFEPHASFAKVNVNEGDFVCLRNMQVKMDNVNGLMEGVLRTDHMYPEKISVSVIPNNDPDEHVREVVRRKTAYWKKTKADKRQAESKNKRQLSDTEGNNSKRAQKTKQKDKRKQLRKDTPPPPKREQLNPLVRAAHPAIPCTSVRDIVSDESHKNSGPGGVEYILPFQNLRYRASVRVVDFFPPKLEDFAVQRDLPSGDDNDDGDSNGSDVDSSERPIGWEWRFCLLVEDSGPGTHYNRDEPKERMKLFVAGSDAEFLLKLDATNLRENPQTLAELREKLFILWGNLEECKSSNPDFHPDDPGSVVSSRPFVCCIKEYGVPTLSDAGSSSDDDDEGIDTRLRDSLGWERRFRMFETTLLG